MNPFKFILCSLLFMQHYANAQQNEIGFSLLQFSTNVSKTQEDFYPNINSSFTRTSGFNFSPLLQFTHLKKNQIEWTIQYGFAPVNIKSSNQFMREGSSNIEYYKQSFTRKSQTLRLGIGKRNQWNHFLFSTMFYIPVQVAYANKSWYSIKSYDSAKNMTKHIESSRTEPIIVSVDLAIAQAVYYPIFKRFFIGAELNIGLSLDRTFGNSTQHDFQIDNGVLTNNKISTTKKSNTAVNSFFNPSICLKYQLGQFSKK